MAALYVATPQEVKRERKQRLAIDLLRVSAYIESMATLTEKIARVEALSAMWLNRGNEASTKEEAERCYEKAGAYLDRANDLRGNN